MSGLIVVFIALISISPAFSQGDCKVFHTLQSNGQVFGVPWLPEVMRRFKVTIDADEAIIYLSNVARATVGVDSYYRIVLDGTVLGLGGGGVGSTIFLGEGEAIRREGAVDFLFSGIKVDIWIDVSTSSEGYQRIEVLNSNEEIIISWTNTVPANTVFIRYVGVRNWGADASFEFCDVLPILRSKGKPASQSTTHSGYEATLAVDGHDDFTSLAQLSCTLTTDSDVSWWMVDLGQEYNVKMVILINRLDENEDLLIGSQVSVGSCPAGNRNNNKLCDVSVTSAEGNDGIPILKTCAANTYGQFVFVAGTQRTLTLCEVKVYGEIILDADTTKLYFPSFTYEQHETQLDLSVTVGRTGVYSTCSSVDISVTDKSATRDSDYTILNTGVSFGIGDTLQQINMKLTNDALAESKENFTITLDPFSAVGASAVFIESLMPVTVTITDDDSVTYRFAKATYQVTEFDKKVVIEVSRSGGTANPGDVVLTTTLASALPVSDFDHAQIMLHFDPDVTSLTGEIAIVDDTKVEMTKQFSVGMEVTTSYGNVDPDNARTTITIQDDDDEFYLENSVLEVMESDASVVIEVRRQGALDLRSPVELTITSDTATPGNDYTSPNIVNLIFEPSIDKVSHTIYIIDDTFGENSEQFYVALRTDAGEIVKNREMLTVTITDNDARYFLKSESAVVSELDRTVQITVVRSGFTGMLTTARITTSFISASNNDFTSLLYYPVTFNQGEDEVTFSIIIQDDREPEALETFAVYIDAADGFIASPSEAVITIVDNDGKVNLGADSYSVKEEHHQVTVDIVRDGMLDNTASVRLLSSTSSATTQDYLTVDETLIFPIGLKVLTVPILITQDNIPEEDEIFILLLTSATNATLGDVRQATVTIISSEAVLATEVPMVVTDDSGLPLAAIIGMAVAGGVLIILLIATTACVLCLRASRSPQKTPTLIQNKPTTNSMNQGQSSDSSYPFAGRIATAFDGFQGTGYWDSSNSGAMMFGGNPNFMTNNSPGTGSDQQMMSLNMPTTYREFGEGMLYSNNQMPSLLNY